jgi:hypothetical protein
MPTRGEVFPSKFLNASNIKGRTQVTIAEVKQEVIADEDRWVCYFEEIDKGLPLNVTNWNSIEEITGLQNSDDWGGTKVVLYATRVLFKGKKVDGLRVDAVPNNGGGKNGMP